MLFLNLDVLNVSNALLLVGRYDKFIIMTFFLVVLVNGDFGGDHPTNVSFYRRRLTL